MSNFDIIIQGPLHQNSVSNIDIYKKFGNVIFISWANDTKNIDLIQQIYDNGAFFIALDHTKITASSHNKQNILKQSLSSYYGCKFSRNNYLIKLRSDEKYSDLEPLINKFSKNTNKIITSNIFFRKYIFYPYHISDHIICGKKTNLENIFLNTIKLCTDMSYILNIGHRISKLPPRYRLVAEQLITVGSIDHFIPNKKFIWTDKNFCTEYIKTYFDLIDVNELGNFLVSFKKGQNRIITSNSKDFLNPLTDIISSIEEYV